MNNNKPMRNDVCFIIEEGYETKYTQSKMQGASVYLVVLKSNATINKQIEGIGIWKRPGKNIKFYVLGSSVFFQNVSKKIKDIQVTAMKSDDERKYECKTITDIEVAIEEAGVKFPENPKVKVKEEKKSKIQSEIEALECDEFTEEEIAAVMLAVDELKTMKIFPAEFEVIYNALIKTTKMYLSDTSKAESLVSFYIEKVATK